VLRRAREVVGRDYRFSLSSTQKTSSMAVFSVEDMLELSALLEEAGINAIELSGGSTASEAKYSSSRLGAVPKGEAYYRTRQNASSRKRGFR